MPSAVKGLSDSRPALTWLLFITVSALVLRFGSSKSRGSDQGFVDGDALPVTEVFHLPPLGTVVLGEELHF